MAQTSPLLTLQADKRGTTTLLDGTILSIHEELTTDWNFYSKAYHRTYGPKVTVDCRYARFTAPDGTRKEIAIEAFRGNYLLQALVAYAQLPTLPVARGLKPAQLLPQASLELLHRRGQVAVYARRLAGNLLDYVVVCQGQTYHGSDISAAKAGWKAKQAARQAIAQQVLDYPTARHTYGFCHEGIAHFCELNQLDIEGRYTRAELQRAVALKQDENCALFAQELRTVRIATC